jgi:large subunit ribosomal protein L24
MQRVLRRNVLARNQALKRQRRASEKEFKDEERKIRQEKVLRARFERDSIKAERKNRREDWMLGPLAPNRLAGNDAGGYGMLGFESIRQPLVPKQERVKWFNFAVDDRIVVVNGREKGKIGKITTIDKERQTVEVAGINMVSISLSVVLDCTYAVDVMLRESTTRSMPKCHPPCAKRTLRSEPLLYHFPCRMCG